MDMLVPQQESGELTVVKSADFRVYPRHACAARVTVVVLCVCVCVCVCHCVHGSNLLVAQLRDKRSYYRARFVSKIVFPYLRAHAIFIRETDSFPSVFYARDCTRAVNFYAHVQRIARLSII